MGNPYLTADQSYLFLSLRQPSVPGSASPDPGDSCHFRDPAIFSPDIWTAIDIPTLDEEAELAKRMLYLLNQAKMTSALQRTFGFLRALHLAGGTV